MEKLVIYFTPAKGQLAGLIALLVICAGLFLIGKLVRRQNALPEINLIAGWSTASLIMIVGTGLLKIDLRIITAILAAAAVFAAVRMFRRSAPDGSSDLIRSMFLALPLLWLTAAMMISQWDEFTHWMPNARYLVEHNILPAPDTRKQRPICRRTLTPSPSSYTWRARLPDVLSKTSLPSSASY